MSVRRLVLLLLGGVAAAFLGSLALASAAHADTNPSAPRDVHSDVVTMGSNGTAYLQWTAPLSNGGSALTYTVSDGTTTTSPSSATTAEFGGLTPGATTTLTVKATNAGSLSSQTTIDVHPIIAPSAPTSVTASKSGTTANVSWTAPSSWGDGTEWKYYEVVPRIAGVEQTGLTQYAYPGSETSAFTGLNSTTSYTFVVRAYAFLWDESNYNGWATGGSTSAPSAPFSFFSTPTPPTSASPAFWTDTTTSHGTVFWTAPTDAGGGALTYTVTASPGGATATATGTNTHATVYGLTPGTNYTFTVRATNGGGLYSETTTTPLAPMTAPTTPTGVSATAGNTTASVTWTASTIGSGSTIDGYTVLPRIGTTPQYALQQWVTSGTTANFTGLTNGTAYNFIVKAQGHDSWSNGISAFSTPSSAAVPATTPAAPTGLDVAFWAEGSTGQGSVFFTDSATSGGGALTYKVTASPGGATATVGAGIGVATVQGLTPGTNYTFTVRATNAGGLYAEATSPTRTLITPASAPTAVTATAGNGTANVTWTAPSSTGSGTSIDGYVLKARIGTAVQQQQWITTGTSGGFTGLTNGTAYNFVVIAQTHDNWGNAQSAVSTASSAVVPATTPAAPTGLDVAFWAEGSTGQGSVFFTDSATSGGGALTYKVTASPGGATATVGAGIGVATVQGLTPGTNYTFTVRATNAGGLYAEATSPTRTLITPASAPTAVTATAGNGTANVSWTAPSSTGSGTGIDGYVLKARIGTAVQQQQWITTGTSGGFTGLTNGTAYNFVVIAQTHDNWGNAQSAASTASSAVVPATTPAAPTGLDVAFWADGDTGQGSVFFTDSASSGGGALTYKVTASPGGATATVGAGVGVATIQGLTPGTNYTFTVRATNAGGLYAEATSPTRTLINPASAPTAVTATAGNGTANLSWTAPTSTGTGTGIDGYWIKIRTGTTVVNYAWVTSGTSTTITGLTNGTAYNFVVQAQTHDSWGNARSVNSSASSSVTPTA